MHNRKGVLVALFFVASFFGIAPHRAPAVGTATPAYCTPPVILANGPHNPVDAPTIMRIFSHAETCPGQVGDFYTDGAIENPVFSYSGSSYAFTIPALDWIAGGNRIHTATASLTAPASATSYWFVDPKVSPPAFTRSLTNTPPTASSVLEYTVVADGSGITGVTFPLLTMLKVSALNLASLSASSSVCTDSQKTLTTSGCPTPPPVPNPLPTGQGGTGLQIPDRGNNAMLNAMVCDNSTNDATAFAAAPSQLVIPFGRTCRLQQGWTSLKDGTTSGPGLLASFDSSLWNLRAPTNIVMLSAPTFNGTQPFDPITGFNGDTSHIALAFESLINNSSGCIPSCPSSAYAVSPNTEGIVGVCKWGANAGYQSGSAGVRGVGRTMLPCAALSVSTAAQGDNPGLYISVFDSAPLPPYSPTDWLGSSAGAGIAIQVLAGADHVYLHPGGDVNCTDQGWDAECVGVAYNLNRTNNTAAYHESWEYIRAQGTMTVPVNAILMATAMTPIGIDFSSIRNAGSAPTSDLVMKGGDSINWNATNTAPTGASGHFAAFTNVGTEKTAYNPSTNALETTIGGTLAEQVLATIFNIPTNAIGFPGNAQAFFTSGYTGASSAYVFTSANSGNIMAWFSPGSGSARAVITGNGNYNGAGVVVSHVTDADIPSGSAYCATTGGLATPCPNATPNLQSTGNVNASTGTTPSTYVQLGSDVTISAGAGSPMIEVDEYANTATAFTAENATLCITSPSTWSLPGGAPVDGATGICRGTGVPLGQRICGSTPFGNATAGTGGGDSQAIRCLISVSANSTTTLRAWVDGNTATSVTLYGYLSARVIYN